MAEASSELASPAVAAEETAATEVSNELASAAAGSRKDNCG
ncbi:hypothetical protein [Micromonospora musae]